MLGCVRLGLLLCEGTNRRHVRIVTQIRNDHMLKTRSSTLQTTVRVKVL